MQPIASRLARAVLTTGFVTALALASLGGVARAGVLVVNAQGGAPYTTIQAAIDAAVDGDVILVKPAAYASLDVADKALTIVGDPVGAATVRVVGTMTVRNVAATRTVVLANLQTYPFVDETYPPVHGLVVFGIDGQLRLHNCTFRGRQGDWMPEVPYVDGYGMGSPGGIGVSIEDCSGSVAFEGCTITGGRGGEVCGTGIDLGGLGGTGLLAAGARVALYDCSVFGGFGGDGSGTGGDAGSAMISRTHNGYGSQLMASNTHFVGGVGAFAEDLGNYYIGPGGDGGHGLVIEAGALAWQLDCTYVGGAGGRADYAWPDGAPGQGLVNGGTASTFQVSRVALSAPAIVREGASMSFTFSGDPGDELYLFEARRTSFVGIPSWRGFLLARPNGLLMHEVVPTSIATIPAGGQATVAVPAPDLAPGIDGRTFFFQAYRKTQAGSITLGAFAAPTVVRAGF